MSDYTLYWEAQSGAFAPQVMLEESGARTEGGLDFLVRAAGRGLP